jgi:hypothetical protein
MKAELRQVVNVLGFLVFSFATFIQKYIIQHKKQKYIYDIYIYGEVGYRSRCLHVANEPLCQFLFLAIG